VHRRQLVSVLAVEANRRDQLVDSHNHARRLAQACSSTWSPLRSGT
jgi:hypothetical protein